MSDSTTENTDITLLTTHDGCRVFVTQGREGLGIDVGGHCIVKPVRDWFALATPAVPAEPAMPYARILLYRANGAHHRTILTGTASPPMDSWELRGCLVVDVFAAAPEPALEQPAASVATQPATGDTK